MRLIPLSLGLPLLKKELAEQANRRRTYVIRVVYASLLYLGFVLFYWEWMSSARNNIYWVFGRGRELFEFLIGIQFAGIFIFLPAMVSGVLTYEKERRSLELLFLTDLRPWEIVLQKLGGRLVPMFTFLLLSLPLMAIAYSFGGISMDYLMSGIFLLFLTCLQVGSLALMVSSFFRTTVQSFIAAYALGFLFYIGFPILCLILDEFNVVYGVDEEVAFALLPVFIFFEVSRKGFGDVVVSSIPIMVSIGVFLLMSRVFLIRRAFAASKSLTLSIFKILDRIMSRANIFVGNIMVVKDKGTFPEDEPIAWREVTKRSLGRVHYLFRILVVTEIPIILVVLLLLGSRPSRWDVAGVMGIMVFILWVLATLAVSVTSANAMVAERTNQTLEVLLATPMTGQEIIRQKTRGVWRIIYTLLIPFMTLFLVEAWWEGVGDWGSGYRSGYGSPELGPIGYLVASVLSVFIYLPMLMWVSMWLGLKIRTRSRAIITMLGVLVGWSVGPLILMGILCVLAQTDPERSGLSYMMLLSPATIVPCIEFANIENIFDDVFNAPAPVIIFLNFLWHGGVLFFFHHLCMKHADRYLGRAEGLPSPRAGITRLAGPPGDAPK